MNEWEKPESIEHVLNTAAKLATAAATFTSAVTLLKKTFPKKATKHDFEELTRNVRGIVDALTKLLPVFHGMHKPAEGLTDLCGSIIKRLLQTESDLKLLASTMLNVEDASAGAITRLSQTVTAIDARLKALEATKAAPRRTRTRTAMKAKKNQKRPAPP